MNRKKYKVVDISYGLQTEGYWTGTPMVFVRLTSFDLADGEPYKEMSEGEILASAKKCGKNCRRLCLPDIRSVHQADNSLIWAFHLFGYKVHLETDGTCPLPDRIDWVSVVSPPSTKLHLKKADELRLVYAKDRNPEKWTGYSASWHYLKPDQEADILVTEEAMAYVMDHPVWRFSR